MLKSFSAAAALVLSAGLSLGLVACGSDDETIPPPPATNNSIVSPPGAVSPPASADDAVVKATKDQLGGTEKSNGQTGKLVYKVEVPANEEHEAYVETVANAAIMTSSIHQFNQLFTFPTDVPVVVKSCNMVNAFYSRATHSISICYELIDALHQAYAAEHLTAKTDEEQLAVTAHAMAFVLIHEVGHAFLNENKIAILGKEEDVVDDISGVLFVTGQKPEVPYYGTISMVALQPSSSVFSDEHSFSLQRYYNALCLIYGSNPTKFAAVVGPEAEGKLPEPRAARCPNEWATKTSALKTIVAPFLRK